MPAYTPLQSIELTAATSSVTFSGIPQTYQDLVLSVSAIGSTAGADIRVQLNSDTGSNYSITRLVAYTTIFSNRASSATYFQPTNSVGIGTTEFTASTFNFINYSNTTTNKTMLVRHNQPQGSLLETAAHVGLWRNTAAITSITFTLSSGNYSAGSTFDLYGISPVAANNAQAAGGTDIYYDASYVYHVFKGSGTFTPYRNLTCDYLVIAGGGGGGTGQGGGGGGGAGGLRSTVGATGGGGSLESALSLTANTTYTVTVGAGGSGGVGTTIKGTNGANSVFSTITATGGGGGSGGSIGNEAQTGGSGGGGNYFVSSGAGGARTASPVQGNNGGSAGADNAFGGGGGGGAGAVGANGTTTIGGNGGNGVTISTLATATDTGVSSVYAGGGGGGRNDAGTLSSGGSGGGGGGGGNNIDNASFGRTNTGGGGGAGGGGNKPGKSGGSGLVIIRYAR